MDKCITIFIPKNAFEDVICKMLTNFLHLNVLQNTSKPYNWKKICKAIEYPLILDKQ